jgi:hypothetical protein
MKSDNRVACGVGLRYETTSFPYSHRAAYGNCILLTIRSHQRERINDCCDQPGGSVRKRIALACRCKSELLPTFCRLTNELWVFLASLYLSWPLEFALIPFDRPTSAKKLSLASRRIWREVSRCKGPQISVLEFVA